jgi:hypothetical protein
MFNAKRCDKRQTLQNKKNKSGTKKKILMTNKFVLFGERKLKNLVIKINMTEFSEDKQKLVGNLE